MPRRGPIAALLLGALAVALAAGATGCGGDSGSEPESVAPAGAPYSYTVPDGFEEIDATFPGGGARFLTDVVPSGTSHEGFLSAFQMPLDSTRREYPTARLLDWLDRQTQSFYRGEGATLSPGRRTEVAGHDAVCWKIHRFENAADGLVDADSCAIVAGDDVVQQACAWKPRTRAVIQRGCEALRGTLKVS